MFTLNYRQLKKPSLTKASTNEKIYWQSPPFFEQKTRPNLEKQLSSIVEEGEDILITDSSLPISLTVKISYI